MQHDHLQRPEMTVRQRSQASGKLFVCGACASLINQKQCLYVIEIGKMNLLQQLIWCPGGSWIGSMTASWAAQAQQTVIHLEFVCWGNAGDTTPYRPVRFFKLDLPQNPTAPQLTASTSLTLDNDDYHQNGFANLTLR